MSKSAPSADSRILLTDTPTIISKKLRSAVTDSERVLTYDAVHRPGVSNLIDILSACTGESIEDIVRRLDGKGHSDLKTETAEALVGLFDGPRKEFERLREDEAYVKQVMSDGAEKARVIARGTLREVKERIGLA